MLTPADLAEIRERHTTTFADLLRCGHDGDRWPCDAARLLARVAALGALVSEPAQFPDQLRPDPSGEPAC